MKLNTILHGDALTELKKLEDNSIDACVTDPPYGIGFMGKEWDNFNPAKIDEAMAKDKRKHTQIMSQRRSNTAGTYDLSRRGMLGFQNWCYQWAKEVLRVLKAGGHLLSFGGSRTYHRMACAIEDAGFEIRDQIMWVYGSGFPKSHAIGKAMDKLQGNEREVLREGKEPLRQGGNVNWDMRNSGSRKLTKGTSEWEGWGTALKPAHEPIVLARKPLNEKTVAANVLKWGTGGLNIDASRVALNGEKNPSGSAKRVYKNNQYAEQKVYGDNKTTSNLGRFPANFIHDGSVEVLELFPNVKTGEIKPNQCKFGGIFGNNKLVPSAHRASSGSAARFFYCAKASKKERDMGLESVNPHRIEGRDEGQDEMNVPYKHRVTPGRNHHTCVKPLALMRYLVKLVIRKGQIVLDPVAGSGSTLIACKQIGRNYIGIELNEEYIEIAEKRIVAFKETS